LYQHRMMRFLVVFVALFAMTVGQGTWVLAAGTTGSIAGTVTDRTANTPVAGAKVTATSPSQVATTTTDASGHFTLLSLAPDTYTLSAEKAGLENVSIGGVSVQADQSITVNLVSAKELRTIGRVNARASGSLVKAGVTSDVYSINAAQQAAAAPLGGGNNLNSVYSALQSVPGVLVPISNQPTGQQSIFIRGGDYTQTGNEVDGVPINRAFDQYAGSPLSNLGTAETQLYTGNQPADAQANGLAGYVNQVIRSGTYPGVTSSQFGVGSPGYYKKFSFETGGATRNRNFSYFLGFLGYNQQNRFVDQFNGASYLPAYGDTINYVAANCASAHPSVGCYTNGSSANLLGNLPLGPNGYVTATAPFGLVPSFADREGVVNLHIGVPHGGTSGLKDDVQLLFNSGQTYDTPNGNFGSFDASLGDVINGTAPFGGVIAQPAPAGCPPAAGAPPVTCAPPVLPHYIDQNYYTGPLSSRLTPGDLGLVSNQFFAGSVKQRAFGAVVPFNQRDSETVGFAIGKVQYQHNFSSSAYARAYVYSLYSDRIDNGIVGVAQNYLGAFSSDYLISSHTRGAVLTLNDQVDPHNLLQFNAAYSYSNTTRYRNDVAAGAAAPSAIAYLVSSANPTAGCYSATGALARCGKAAAYVLPPAGGNALVPRGASPTLGTETALNCGGAPCEYLAVNSGSTGASNTVSPAFTNASISDLIRPTDKLTVTAALRFEDFNYKLRQTNTLGNQLLVSDYNRSHCVAGTTITPIPIGTACPAGSAPAALSAVSPRNLDYGHVFSPRFGFTYSLDPNTVIRASYGRFTQPAETSAVQATNVQSGAPSAPFYANFGFASYARNVEPEISYNTDFSLEKAFPRQNVQLSLSPFYRKTNNEFVAILVDPKTNFIANINGLNRETKGFEFAVSKGSFDRDGFATRLAYTYTNAVARYKVFPNGGSLVAGANTAIQQYNGYTRFCAHNPTATVCGPTQSGVAAPCYTVANAPDPACAAGSVANPYWNAPPLGLLDPKAGYVPYNQSIGPGASGGATSYIVPHVASLIVSYKHGPLTVQPSVQFQGGSRYGSPFVAQGVAPDTCTAGLGPAANDPRYPYGSPGGNGYNAATCGTVIPIPNPQTKAFDGIGAFTQPNLIATNLSVNYDFNKQFGLQVIAANIYNRCFGGTTVPWGTGNIGCAYGQAGTYVANVYNPGDTIQQYAANSYSPVLGGALQSVSASAPLPFELYVNFNLHL